MERVWVAVRKICGRRRGAAPPLPLPMMILYIPNANTPVPPIASAMDESPDWAGCGRIDAVALRRRAVLRRERRLRHCGGGVQPTTSSRRGAAEHARRRSEERGGGGEEFGEELRRSSRTMALVLLTAVTPMGHAALVTLPPLLLGHAALVTPRSRNSIDYLVGVNAPEHWQSDAGCANISSHTASCHNGQAAFYYSGLLHQLRRVLARRRPPPGRPVRRRPPHDRPALPPST